MASFIDQMRIGDWEQVRAIYLEGIRSGHATFETEAPGWERWDEAHLPFARLVMRDGAAVFGLGGVESGVEARGLSWCC